MVLLADLKVGDVLTHRIWTGEQSQITILAILPSMITYRCDDGHVEALHESLTFSLDEHLKRYTKV